MKEKIRVLYAEDHPPDAYLTKVHFEPRALEFELETVDTGRECLTRLQETKFDVLLLDNHLPDMDGIEVLKELEARKVSLPVVMVTGVGDESLVVQVLRLGAWDYVPKEGNYLETLPAVLKRAVSEYHGRGESGQPARQRKRHVLYLEHHQADIDLTLKHFAEAAPHFTLDVVHSAKRALARLQEANFDLVLSDLRIPDMNALEFLREAKHRGLQTPSIIITGKGDEAAAVAALKLGAYDYIVKRDDYLIHLPYAIDNAISRAELVQVNRRLQTERVERERAEEQNAHLLDEVLGHRRRVDEVVASVPGIVWEAWGRPDQPDQKIDFVSNQVERLLGYSVDQWLSTANFWLSIVHPEDRSRAAREAAEIFASGEGGVSQFRWLAKSGDVVWVEDRSTVICDNAGKPLGMRGVTMDITASKEAERARLQLEEQLRQAQKMESIGRLAGGVAHDFNNLLTAINGYADLMLAELRPSDPLRLKLVEIRRAGKHGAALIRQLLAFSRRQVLQPSILSLNSLITDSVQILQRLLGEDVELVTLLDPELGHVKADSGQMEQVILNLAVNARDAMPCGGRFTLETRNVNLDTTYAQEQLSLPSGAYVVLAFSDTGGGMDAQILSHIFEPFFTTKEQGKGTGLGLSTVYGIIKQSDGSISVRSEPGRGSTFEVYLPHIQGVVASTEEKQAEAESPHGSEIVLVVEDEPMVLKLTSAALRKYGYEVIEAASSGEALWVCQNHKGRIALMITDVVMPQMGGPELATKLRSRYPNIRVLYMSGYAGDVVFGRGLLDPAMVFLQKPFTPNALARKVREILDQGSSAAAR